MNTKIFHPPEDPRINVVPTAPNNFPNFQGGALTADKNRQTVDVVEDITSGSKKGENMVAHKRHALIERTESEIAYINKGNDSMSETDSDSESDLDWWDAQVKRAQIMEKTNNIRIGKQIKQKQKRKKEIAVLKPKRTRNKKFLKPVEVGKRFTDNVKVTNSMCTMSFRIAERYIDEGVIISELKRSVDRSLIAEIDRTRYPLGLRPHELVRSLRSRWGCTQLTQIHRNRTDVHINCREI